MSVLLAALLAIATQTPQRFVAVSGQSLSTGCYGAAISTSVVGTNKGFTGNTNNTCASFSGQQVPWPLIDLVESSNESPRGGMANYYYTATGNPVASISNGVSATAYSGMKRGTTPWTYFDFALTHWGARVTGDTVLGLVLVHGESDRLSATYLTDMLEWQSDFDANVRAHTSSRGYHPLWISQMSSCTFYSTTSINTCTAPKYQYQIARQYPTRAKLVGPKYQYAYTDGVHLDAASSRWHGAQIGYAMAWGESWQPFWPVLDNPVSRSGAVITVSFWVPVPPIVIDAVNITGTTKSGFEYVCGSSPPAIDTVDCSAPCVGNVCSCAITLASTPGAPCLTDDVIQYAWSGTSGNASGPTTGMRGNLRDSNTASWQGATLYNRCVHFQETVPN